MKREEILFFSLPILNLLFSNFWPINGPSILLQDTKVGFDDYKTSCDHERLLLEFLGEVLPEKRQVACFFRYLEKCDKNQSFYI